MPVPSKMADLFTLAASNSPAGSDAIGNSLDDYLRATQAILRSTNALASATLPSGSTTDLGTADAESVQITGSSTITSFGTSVPGLVRECRFAGALTINNSSAIVLPGGANITTVAGDVLRFRSLGSGNWIYTGGTKGGFLPLTGGTVSGNTTFNAALIAANGFVANIASLPGTPGTGLIAQAGDNGLGTKGAAWINFTRPGITGINLGLDSDNVLRVGGGLFGSNSYRVVHEQLTSVNLPGSLTCASIVQGNKSIVDHPSSPIVQLSVSGQQVGALFWESNTRPLAFGRYAAGSFVGYYASTDASGNWSANNWIATSDRNLKDDIQPRRARDLAAKLDLNQWTMKADGSFGMGVVAQDVQEVAPEHVFTDASGHLAIDKAGIALEAVIALAYRVRELEGKA